MHPVIIPMTALVIVALLGGMWAMRTDRSAMKRAVERQKRKQDLGR